MGLHGRESFVGLMLRSVKKKTIYLVHCYNVTFLCLKELAHLMLCFSVKSYGLKLKPCRWGGYLQARRDP